jgi:hypothetical protein
MAQHPFPTIHAKVPDWEKGEKCLLWCEATGRTQITRPRGQFSARAGFDLGDLPEVRTFFLLAMKYGVSGAVKVWNEFPLEVAFVASWLSSGPVVSG